MAYSVRIIVYSTDDPKVQESIRAAVECHGGTIQELSEKTAGYGDKELFVELRLTDRNVIGRILRSVESVKGAAIMAATEPKEIHPLNRARVGVPGAVAPPVPPVR